MRILVHLRLNVPSEISDEVAAIVAEHDFVTNVTRLPGASLAPVGDVIEVDVAREVASDLLEELRQAGLEASGGIVLFTPSGTPFAEALRIDEATPGDSGDSVIWESVLDDADEASRGTWSFYIFLTIATILAAVAVLTDSTVLVVGAMVVGPDFAAVSANCTGLVFGNFALADRAAKLLVLSFATAIALVAVLALIARATGMITPAMVSAPRPQTDFIWHPDQWTLVVAVVAGTAGVLALSTDKGAAMVGVFIAATTVPAAGNLALALATWEMSELRGSAAQLALNIAGMVVAGTLTLGLLLVGWLARERRRAERVPADSAASGV